MRIARSVVVVVIGSMILVSGTANAATSATAADSVQRLHDRLAVGYHRGDIAAMKAVVADLEPILGALSSQDSASDVRSEVRASAAEAHRLNAELAAGLSASPAAEQRILPPLPGPLWALANLFDALLASLSILLASLFGGGIPAPPPVPGPPAPIPVP